MPSFWHWLRAEIAPDGLSDTVLALASGAFAWLITDFLRSIFTSSAVGLAEAAEGWGLAVDSLSRVCRSEKLPEG